MIHEGETLAVVKVRIQKKLQVPDEEFSKVLLILLLSFGYSAVSMVAFKTSKETR